MANMSDAFKEVFLAGVGAVAIGAEKSKELIDQFIAKGELTVDEGKSLNAELKHKAEVAAATVQDDVLAAHMAAMTPEQRHAFAKKAAEYAADPSSIGMVDPTTNTTAAAGREEEARVVAQVEKTEK